MSHPPDITQEAARQMLAALRSALVALNHSFPVDRTPHSVARHRLAFNAVEEALTAGHRALAHHKKAVAAVQQVQA